MSQTQQQRRGVWQRLSLKQLRWVAILAFLLTTAAFGGLQTADHKTTLSFGQVYDNGPLRIAAHSASLTRQGAALLELSPECRYLMVTATIQNVANDSVPFPLAAPLIGRPTDCNQLKRSFAQMFGITGVTAHFAGAFRGHEQLAAPSIEPGFTNEYSLFWVLPEVELRSRPEIGIRFYQMSQFISAYRIDRGWASDENRYGELRLTDAEPR